MRLKKAIAYIRRSTKKQKHSEEAQIDEIEKFAKRYGFKIIQFYRETASGKTIDRPGLEKALQQAKKEGVPIIVDSISRIGRDAGQVISLLNRYFFISVEDGLDAEEHELHSSAVEAQREGKRISRRSKHALSVAKKKGVAIGNPQIEHAQKLGVAKVKKNADEFALKFKKFFELMKKESHSSIARDLNELDIETRQGKQWRPQTVANVRKRLKRIKEERQIEEDSVGDLFEYVAQMFESGDFNLGIFK